MMPSGRDWRRIAATVREVESTPVGQPKRRNSRSARGVAPTVHLVRVKWSGSGDGGGQTTPPSFRYDVWLYSAAELLPETRILEDVAVEYRDQDAGLAIVAADNTEAFAARDASGWRLLAVLGEEWKTGPCDGAG